MLPQIDSEVLSARTLDHTVSMEANMVCVLIRNFVLPAGFDRSAADLLLRLSPGYPDVPPDMWWFDPPVRRLDGAAIAATQITEQHLGRSWQRWSRHLNPGQWRSGVDTIETYIALIRAELRRAAPAMAA